MVDQSRLGGARTSPVQPRSVATTFDGSGRWEIHNVVVNGRRTSIRLEPALWDARREVAYRREITVDEFATEIADQRTFSNPTTAVRAYIVLFHQNAVSETSAAKDGERPACVR